MAGHSKWANIKHRKAAQDAKRGKIFTKIIRELVVAAREGGGDPNDNPRLRAAMDKALGANMKKDTIEKAVDRGTGNAEGDNYEELNYEGYGPGGTAVIVEVMTDNKNRTVSEIRRAFSKFGGNLGESGCVSWNFDRKGRISFSSEGVNEDDFFEKAIELGAEDINNSDGNIEVITSIDDFENLRVSIESLGHNISAAEISMIPKNSIKIEGKPAEHMLKMMEALEDCDDVQNVYSNFDIDDEVIEALT